MFDIKCNRIYYFRDVGDNNLIDIIFWHSHPKILSENKSVGRGVEAYM